MFKKYVWKWYKTRKKVENGIFPIKKVDNDAICAIKGPFCIYWTASKFWINMIIIQERCFVDLTSFDIIWHHLTSLHMFIYNDFQQFQSLFRGSYQICSLTDLSLTWIILVLKSTPIVGSELSWKESSTNLEI